MGDNVMKLSALCIFARRQMPDPVNIPFFLSFVSLTRSLRPKSLN